MRNLSLISLLLALTAVAATPAPANTATCAAGTASSNNVFGVKRVLNTITQLRGGELHEPDSLEEMDAIVSDAASNQQLVVIDFTATWCGPCKMIAPIFKELSQEMSDVVFVKVDVDENPDTAAKYSVSAMPTFVFIKGGEVVDRLMGANAARLQELIQEHM